MPLATAKPAHLILTGGQCSPQPPMNSLLLRGTRTQDKMLSWMPFTRGKRGGKEAGKGLKLTRGKQMAPQTIESFLLPSLHCWPIRSEVSSSVVAELLVRREEGGVQPRPPHKQRKMVSQAPADRFLRRYGDWASRQADLKCFQTDIVLPSLGPCC